MADYRRDHPRHGDDTALRLARVEHVGQLVSQLAGFALEAPPWFPLPELPILGRDLGGHIRRHPVLVLERAGALEGSIGLVRMRWAWSSQAFLTDLWTYIPPAHRSLAAFRRLHRGARAVAAGLGLPLVLAQTSGQKIAPLEAFYSREGGRKLGSVYLWT